MGKIDVAAGCTVAGMGVGRLSASVGVVVNTIKVSEGCSACGVASGNSGNWVGARAWTGSRLTMKGG